MANIEWAFHYHLGFLKISGFQNETYSEILSKLERRIANILSEAKIGINFKIWIL
jgi:hypothetical protein